MASERPSKKQRLVDKAPPEHLEAMSEPVQYHCDYCRRDLSNTVRVRCAECAEFDLCVACFSQGVELRSHKNSHDYRVIDNMHFPFLAYNWSADEEQLMLEGLEKYGLGNWVTVSDEVSTKTKEEVRDHYKKFYMDSPKWPRPNYNNLIADRDRVRKLNSGKYNKIKRPEGVMWKPEVLDKHSRRVKEKYVKPEPPPDPKVEAMNGSMPLRDEFEIEMFPNPEKIVMDISFNDNDTPEEFETKMSLVESYSYRLKEKMKGRRYIVDNPLQENEILERLSRVEDPEFTDAHKQFKRLFQVSNLEEYESFARMFANDKQFQTRVALLQVQRTKPLASLNDAKKADEDKAKKEQDKGKEKEKSPGPKQKPLGSPKGQTPRSSSPASPVPTAGRGSSPAPHSPTPTKATLPSPPLSSKKRGRE